MKWNNSSTSFLDQESLLEIGIVRFPETEKISPPLLQMSEVNFGYTPEKMVLKGINIDVGLDSRIAIVGANGAGKSTLWVYNERHKYQSLTLDQYQNSYRGA